MVGSEYLPLPHLTIPEKVTLTRSVKELAISLLTGGIYFRVKMMPLPHFWHKCR